MVQDPFPNKEHTAYLEVSGNGNPELAALVMAARRAKSLNT